MKLGQGSKLPETKKKLIMDQSTLDDYLNRFTQYINRDIDIFTGVDKKTGKNIYIPYSVISLGKLSSIKVGDEVPIFDQFVILKDKISKKEIIKNIHSVVDYFEKPEIGNKPKRKYLTL